MSSTNLLTTRQAAEILGCSRQHVVDLCDAGRLPFARIGTHRRIRRVDVEALTPVRPLRREALRSLWLHRAVAGKFVADPAGAIALARRNLLRFRAIQPRAGVWLDAWERILDAGPESVLDVLTSTTPFAIDLRQNTPFVGILSDEEQQAVIGAFADAQRASPVGSA